MAPFLCKLYSYSHYLFGLLPAVHCSKIYIINTKIRSCWTLSLGCNCTAICAITSFANCSARTFGFLQRFITVRPSVCRYWHVSKIWSLCYLFYHFNHVFLPFDIVAWLTRWLRLYALKYYLMNPVYISNVIKTIIGTCLKSWLYSF